jgi:transposase
MLKEMSMKIKFLNEQRVPKAQIAQQLGVCRQTVYNHLSREEPFPKPRQARPSKLDAFKDYIRMRLEQFNLPATVLFEELKAQGYAGGLTILRDYVRPLKASLVRRVVERFETRPGLQAQLDWGECGTIQVGAERKKLYVFVLVLGYSRMMYAQFTTSCRLPMLLTCLKAALSFLGVPKEVLVDNMKQAVESHDVSTGTVCWNRQFLDFAAHYGFLPVACPPYWPQAKGKVERGVGYIKSSFLEGRTFTDLDDLNQQLAFWLDAVANCRVHGTTGQRPIDRHALELPHLRPASAVLAYDTRPVEIRQVPKDCHIHYQGTRYSVHPDAVGQTVLIRPEGDDIGASFTVYLGDRVMAVHALRPAGSRPVIQPEHALAIRQVCRKKPNSAAKRRDTGPRFHQCLETDAATAPHHMHAPRVEARSLKAYDALLLEVAL